MTTQPNKEIGIVEGLRESLKVVFLFFLTYSVIAFGVKIGLSLGDKLAEIL